MNHEDLFRTIGTSLTIGNCSSSLLVFQASASHIVNIKVLT